MSSGEERRVPELEKTFKLKIQKHSCSVATILKEVSHQESQARDAAAMRVSYEVTKAIIKPQYGGPFFLLPSLAR